MKIKSMIDKAVSALAVMVLYTASTASTLANMNDEVILYLNDPLGSAVAAYDENGDLCWEEAHTPYGDKTIMEDSFNRQGCGVVAEERGFTGHSEDFETDLVYMQQRYYDPTIGRFLSTDPVGPIPGDPGSTNRYSYAKNSPYSYIDPDGRQSLLFNRKDLSPQQSMQIISMRNTALKAGAGAAAIAGSAVVPGPEDAALAGLAIAAAAAKVTKTGKMFEVPEESRPSVGDLRAAKQKDAHHIIQDAAARDLPNYNTNAAPGFQLQGGGRGTPHDAANQVQRQRGGGTYAAERRIGYKALRRAGVSQDNARGAIERADIYFDSIGVGPNTPMRIPGNRPQ